MSEYPDEPKLFEPTMRLRWKPLEPTVENDGETREIQLLQLQQLYRSADGQEEWRAVTIES